jgi:hypothetical protein
MGFDVPLPQPRPMISRLFGPRLTIRVTILGLVGDRVVRWDGPVTLRGPAATVRQALKAGGRAAGADLLGALDRGAEPSLLLDGRRLDLPADLTAPVVEGASLSWLMPMAGG